MEVEEPAKIFIKKVLPGNIESVRLQLIVAVESLGYDILENEPKIIGRRAAKSQISANVLDSGAKLVIRLKELTDNSTRVTFDYVIDHALFGKAQHAIISQEAQTIVSLCNQSVAKLCSVCELESTDDSKFCRNCGAQLSSEQAESEVLRLMAEAGAAKSNVTASTISMLASTALLLLVFFLNNADLIKAKLVPVLIIVGGLGLFFSVLTSLLGWNRLKRIFETPESRLPQTDPARASIEGGQKTALPPTTSPPASVTERTTSLLDKNDFGNRQKEKVKVSSRRETNDLE